MFYVSGNKRHLLQSPSHSFM